LPDSISSIVKKVARRAAVYEEGFSALALRRYFQRTLEKAETDPILIKIMMGQKSKDIESESLEPNWHQLREAI
jgi:hypothetical protein